MDNRSFEGEQGFVDLTVFGTCISLGCISFTHENYFGMYTAAMYFFNHFHLRRRYCGDIPCEAMDNIGMIFYTYFAFHTLKDSHVSIK